MAIGMWLLMSTAKVYATGVSLARARLGAADGRVRRVAWLPVGLLLSAVAIVSNSVGRAFLAGPIVSPQDALMRLGAAILLSSHLLSLVEEVCTRVIIMDRGRKVADGTFEELRERADLAEAGSNLEQIFLHVTGHDAKA